MLPRHFPAYPSRADMAYVPSNLARALALVRLRRKRLERGGSDAALRAIRC